MNRITSLHEHWSTPEYLQESEEKMRKRMEFDERQKLLGDRQLRLRKLLDDETKKLSEEVQGELTCCFHCKIVIFKHRKQFSSQSTSQSPRSSHQHSRIRASDPLKRRRRPQTCRSRVDTLLTLASRHGSRTNSPRIQDKPSSNGKTQLARSTA